MSVTIIFPCSYDNPKKVDESYEPECKEVGSIPEFRTVFYDHDRFVDGGSVRFCPKIEAGRCIARTWMMKPEEYIRFYNEVKSLGATLMNTPEEYNLLHLFPNVYPLIQDITPKTLVFSDPETVDAEIVNRMFSRFVMKDYVKSVKGHDFPSFFNTPISQADLDAFIRSFIDLRRPLFTGGIVLKEYVKLKRYGEATNEYRAFYLNHQVLTVGRNSNQPASCPYVPDDLARSCSNLPSHYYTVDFGELEDGRFIILETGDGQVSGLSPNQFVFKYYDEMRLILSGNEAKS